MKQETAQKPKIDIRKILSQITTGPVLISVLAFLLSLVVGAFFMLISGKGIAIIPRAYIALFNGSIIDLNKKSFIGMISPFFSTLNNSVPLIFTGLGLAVGFKTSLFNIGGTGQVIMGAILSATIGFAFHLPLILHLPFAILGGFLGGALYGLIPGLLKAKTGTNEVITTIMLNYIALNFIAFILTQTFYQKPGQNVPITKPMVDSAVFPHIFGNKLDVTYSFVLAIIVVFACHILINKSTLGFGFKAVGENPSAASNAGLKVNNYYIYAMVISGGLCGLAGSSAVLVAGQGMAGGVASTYGFDAITVALLGRSKPIGTFLAALLFSALRTGGYAMSQKTQISVDIVQIIQSMVVLFIAAPPLIRAIFPFLKQAKNKVISKG